MPTEAEQKNDALNKARAEASKSPSESWHQPGEIDGLGRTFLGYSSYETEIWSAIPLPEALVEAQALVQVMELMNQVAVEALAEHLVLIF